MSFKILKYSKQIFRQKLITIVSKVLISPLKII